MNIIDKERKQFLKDLNLDTSYLLDEAIKWIESNLRPEDVFDESALSNWAENNDYIKEN